jgi:hypothetical protein
MKKEYAFPMIAEMRIHYGLTKRQYYAIQALSGLLSARYADPYVENNIQKAFQYADEMIKFEEKELDDKIKESL